LLEKVGLSEKKNVTVGQFSRGMKQRLGIAKSLINKPKIIFLDEPTGGVDPITRRGFWEMIYQVAGQGTTVFVTTHYMDEAEYCDRVTIMVDGRIEALDTPANLKKKFNVSSMDEVFVILARNGKTVA